MAKTCKKRRNGGNGRRPESLPRWVVVLLAVAIAVGTTIDNADKAVSLVDHVVTVVEKVRNF